MKEKAASKPNRIVILILVLIYLPIAIYSIKSYAYKALAVIYMFDEYGEVFIPEKEKKTVHGDFAFWFNSTHIRLSPLTNRSLKYLVCYDLDELSRQRFLNKDDVLDGVITSLADYKYLAHNNICYDYREYKLMTYLNKELFSIVRSTYNTNSAEISVKLNTNKKIHTSDLPRSIEELNRFLKIQNDVVVEIYIDLPIDLNRDFAKINLELRKLQGVLSQIKTDEICENFKVNITIDNTDKNPNSSKLSLYDNKNIVVSSKNKNETTWIPVNSFVEMLKNYDLEVGSNQHQGVTINEFFLSESGSEIMYMLKCKFNYDGKEFAVMFSPSNDVEVVNFKVGNYVFNNKTASYEFLEVSKDSLFGKYRSGK